MRLLTRSLLTGAAVTLAAAVAWPQSLAEIAAREKERQEKERKKAGGPSKVIKEEDLRGRGAGTYSQPGTAASPTAAASPGAVAAGEKGEKPKTEDELQAERESDWRDRQQKAQEEVTRLSGEVDRLQTALNDVSQNLYGATRTGLLNRLDQAQKDLATAKQKVADLQEEGRRSRYR
jgi:hypothetical protein